MLFSVYMNGLFEKLEKSGVGCLMSNHYTGGVGYADDLTLLTPTRYYISRYANNMQNITV